MHVLFYYVTYSGTRELPSCVSAVIHLEQLPVTGSNKEQILGRKVHGTMHYRAAGLPEAGSEHKLHF